MNANANTNTNTNTKTKGDKMATNTNADIIHTTIDRIHESIVSGAALERPKSYTFADLSDGMTALAAMGASAFHRATLPVISAALDGLDEAVIFYRRHAQREGELEAEVKKLTAEVERLKESTAAADEHMYSAEHVQHMADEYQAVIDRQHDELMEAHDRINALEAEVANAGKVVQLAPRGATVEDDGVFLTIDAANAHGFIVRSKDGSPLLLATQNDTNVWFTGDTKALRERIESLTDALSWSAKRKAWWVGKASKTA